MDGNKGLLEKMALLGRHMLPKAAGAAGYAAGGPAGQIAAQSIGSGLEQFFTPSQSPFAGAGYQVQPGSQLYAQEGPSRIGRTLSSLAGQGAYHGVNAGVDQLGSMMGIGSGEQKMSQEQDQQKDSSLPSEEWVQLMQKLMQTVPRDELVRWLEQRNKPQIEGAY